MVSVSFQYALPHESSASAGGVYSPATNDTVSNPRAAAAFEAAAEPLRSIPVGILTS